MTTAKDAQPWLKPYLTSTPPTATLSRKTALNFTHLSTVTAKSGVFSIPFGGATAAPTANTERRRDTGNSVDIFILTVTRAIGFYGVRFDASGYQSWYSKDKIQTPIERFYWGIASFDTDNACILQANLKQSRQIIISSEVLGLVNGLLAVGEDVDLREQVKSLLPSRLSGFIYWEDMTAEVSFFGVTEVWSTSWSG